MNTNCPHIKRWPNKLPKSMRGIFIDRAKILGACISNNTPKHDELLNIHYPTFSPFMKKHPKYMLWNLLFHIKN